MSLLLVAGLFVLVGAGAAWQTIAQSSSAHIFINPGFLGVFVGFGLLRRRQLWRYVALAFVWLLLLALIASVVVFHLYPNGDQNFLAAWNALPIKMSGTNWGLAGGLLLLAWMRWVLTRKDVNQFFAGRER